MSSSSRRPLTRLAVLAATRWKVTIALWLALLVAGGYAYLSGLPREGFPPIDTPLAIVEGAYFADDPERVDADVAQPLGEALLATDEVVAVESFAGPNSAFFIVEFESGISSSAGVALIEGIDRGRIPDDVDIDYLELDAAAFLNNFDLLVSVATAGTPEPAELQAEAARVAAHLEAHPEIAVAEVQPLLTEAVDPATGRRVLRQTSIARVFQTGDDRFLDSVTIGVDRATTNLDTIELSDTVADLLVTAPVSDGYEARLTADFATNIRAQLSNLQQNLLTGLIAVALVSFLLIGWRTAAITAAFMVTVMAATLLSLMLLGQSLNTITLFALILTLGLLVDDAVVIAESIDANRLTDDEPIEVVRAAIDRVGVASFSGTLTTVLVFVPILFVSGILGSFIRIMPITVIIALLSSFFLSITLISASGAAFLLRGAESRSPIIRAQRWLANRLGDLIELIDTRRRAGLAVAAGSILLSLGVVAGAFAVAGGLSFNIFPPSKDVNTILVEADFEPGTTLEDAQVLADRVDAAILDQVGDDLLSAVYVFSGARGVSVYADLTSFADRDTTAGEFADRIEDTLDGVDGLRANVSQVDNGPPVAEFPFAVQIVGQDADRSRALADRLVEELQGATITRANGQDAQILEAIVSTRGRVARVDGERIVEVRARFDADDVTALLNATQDLVESLHPVEDLDARGLSSDALRFDFGQESENQEGFESAGVALRVALVAMLMLLVVQFRSIVQPVLIMFAIPFGLFGVFVALRLSDNPLSFFVMIGLIGLVGVVVNNTILLTDAANQAWRNGASSAASIATAIRGRFRPLVATTVTTVVGLAPLALSDPFWEALSFTIMFGLIASTTLVLVSFPFYYLVLVPPARWLFARVFRRPRA